MTNPNFSLIIPGLGYDNGGEEVLYVFSTKAMGSTSALLALTGVQETDEFICVQNFPSIAGGSIEPLGTISSSTGFGLSLNALPQIRHLLDSHGTPYIYEGKVARLTGSIGSTTTSINVSIISPFAHEDVIIIDREAMRVVGVSMGSLTVVRGILGTTPIEHIRDVDEGLVIWRTLPIAPGTRAKLYHHESKSFTSLAVLSSVETSSNATIELSFDSEHAEFQKLFSTAIPFINDVNVSLDMSRFSRHAPLVINSWGRFYAEAIPYLPIGDHKALLVGKDRTVLINVEVFGSHDFSEGILCLKIGPLEYTRGDRPYLFSWTQELGWVVTDIADLAGEYKIHFYVELDDEEDMTVAGVIGSLLLGKKISDGSELPFGAAFDEIDLTGIDGVGSVSNRAGFGGTGKLILPTQETITTFGQYLSDYFLRPMGVGIAVSAHGVPHGIDWSTTGTIHKISTNDLASDEYSSQISVANTVSAVMIADYPAMKSSWNRAHYASAGKIIQVVSDVIDPEFVLRRWVTLLRYYESAPRMISLELLNDPVVAAYKPGDTVKLSIPRLPDTDGYVDEHSSDLDVYPLNGLIISVSGSYSSPVVNLTILARGRDPFVRWAGSVRISSNQSATTTVLVESDFYTRAGDDTEKIYRLRDNIKLMLLDKFFTRRDSSTFPVTLSGTAPPSNSSIEVSSTFKNAGGIPLSLSEGDLILPAPAQEQYAGWDEHDEYWFANDANVVIAESARRFQ